MRIFNNGEVSLSPGNAIPLWVFLRGYQKRGHPRMNFVKITKTHQNSIVYYLYYIRLLATSKFGNTLGKYFSNFSSFMPIIVLI